jgi:glycosyltransferase involved in cell wall biosynthesis
VTILERGSSHIEYQRDIIKEEYEKLGIRPSLPDPRIVDKEIEEYEETDYISVPSAYTKRTFLEKGIPESKLIHVPYGVDSGVFKQIPKRDVIFRIIFVGQISIRKGIYYLLRAVSELKLKNLELCLIGNIFNETKPFFKKYRGYFSYLGKINFYQLYKYYSQGSVFVLPSIDDGFALVINQAMACGLPVISTFNTGGSEVVRDGIDGFIIPIRNIEALKEKILYLYNNPDVCKKMGESAKERVYRDSSWNQYGEKITKAYLSFLK